MDQVKTYDDNLETMIVGIQPVLDCIGVEQPEGARLPDDGPYRLGKLQGAVVHGPA